MRSYGAWPLLFVAATVGCGAEPAGEPTAGGTSAIAGGTLDADDAAVFQEFTRFPDGVSACTASLIAPNVLLTARHCVSEGGTDSVICGRASFPAPVTGGNTVATNATAPSDRSIYYRGADVRVPSEGSDICGFDVALIILESPVPASQATPLVPRIDLPVSVGEEYTAVGYGVNEGGERNPGRMERGNLAVTCLPGKCDRAGGVAATEFLGETGVCSGDSGGPALDTEGKVIGVVSRGSDPCETPIYGQVASWRNFITQTVLEAAASAGYRAPFWAYSGSSDLDPALAGVGEACADTSECDPGTVCYFESDPSAAVCTPVCANERQCSTGSECRSGFDVPGGGLCFALPMAVPAEPQPGSGLPPKDKRSADDSCAMAPAPLGSPTSAWFALALTLAALGRFSARRASRA